METFDPSLNASDLLDKIIHAAATLKASDIHLEPREEFVHLRYRVDGILQESSPISKSKQASLIARIKILVSMDIAESRLPQDGRTDIKIGKHNIDLRVSTLPTLHGEKVVLRLLNRSQALLTLEELGMGKEEFLSYKAMLAKRSGIILITGPTGSGKTTTLYSTLASLNHKEINIMTIEDPIEYQLGGINQTQINIKAGLTFPRGLRSILRQDPDIIMVGEIRDLETAKVAIQAALTGHLVLSTLHTKDAPSVTSRLVDMGIDRYLVEATVLGVVAQRLVKKIGGGREGIFEVMEGSTPKPNRRTLLDNGKLKIAKGIVTKEEISRVLYLE